jgi:hypothetical protein
MRTLCGCVLLSIFCGAAGADQRFAPVDLTVDVKALAENEQRALGKLVDAAKIMDAIFLKQVWGGNQQMLLELAQSRSPHLAEFIVNKGPWSRLDKNAPFVPGAPPKPAYANFYPADMSKDAIEKWIHWLPVAEKPLASGFFTVIRHAPDGKPTIVPYSVEYQPELLRAGQLLREAAVLTRQPTLKTFLEKRAAAFASNDYYDSDVAWMALDASIEPTIGPYETYEDEWFSAKAAYEAFIAVRDDAETKKLTKFSSQLQDIESHLPIDPSLRNPRVGAAAPIRVVNEIFCAGDANHGVQTAAYNLPNDERFTVTKRVMLKNVQEQKFRAVLLPISKVVLSAADQPKVAFDPFFTHILMHELMHGLGPTFATVNGKKGTIRESLQELYSSLEEAKADISGLWALQFLVDKGVLPKELERSMYVTFLASAFRTIRFGITEAHGKGQALQLNYLVDAGAFKVNADGTYSVVDAKVREGVASLTKEIMTIQAHGDKAAAKQLLDKYVVIRPETQKLLEKLKGVPVDIAPRFVTAEKLPR